MIFRRFAWIGGSKVHCSMGPCWALWGLGLGVGSSDGNRVAHVSGAYLVCPGSLLPCRILKILYRVIMVFIPESTKQRYWGNQRILAQRTGQIRPGQAGKIIL